MAVIKAFKGLRPPASIAGKLASRPYDVLNSAEAKKEAEGNQYSLLHITKPEIDLPEDIEEHSQAVYDKAIENFRKFTDNGWLIPDNDEYLYIYAQTFLNKTQYGLVCCASVDDYMNNVIKKHELTRKDKEEDRMKHVRATQANVEPVFFSYRASVTVDSKISFFCKNNAPEYDFFTEDNVGHSFWVIRNKVLIQELIEAFADIGPLYVADGHHRTAAAALVGNEKRKLNPNYTGKEEFNYFLAVLFPDNQLSISDYNRVVKDLNGLAENEFLSEIGKNFVLKPNGNVKFKPCKLHSFGMYLPGHWYSLEPKDGLYNENNPIDALDVTILSKFILDRILGIKDLRTDKRIEFIGGIRGLKELEKKVDSGEMKVAFSMYPVSMKQLLNIADSGNIMPPKTTWFEPKLRSGLVVHLI